MKYQELNKYKDIPVLDGEEWLPINGYEGYYEISNYGRVKRLPRAVTKSNQYTSWNEYLTEMIYTLQPNTQGYPQVHLNVNNYKQSTVRVHRLVAEHFLTEPSEQLKEECRLSGINYVPVEHEDDDPSNPHYKNLRWCSVSFNNYKAAKSRDYENLRGSNAPVSILKEGEVFEILRLLKDTNMSQEKIGEMFNVKQITISNIKTGRSWSHLTGIEHTPRSVKRSPKPIMEREER